MLQIEIEVEDRAIEQAKKIFKSNREFIDMLNRMGRAFKRHDRYLICRIACTEYEWKRYKDCITGTRTAFIEEKRPGKIILVVKGVLPRRDWTYDLFKFMWERAEV